MSENVMNTVIPLAKWSETEECCGCRATEFGGKLRWNRTCFKERNFL